MASNTARIEMKTVVKDLTISVKLIGLNVWRARLWAGMILIKMGCRVIGCGCDIKDE